MGEMEAASGDESARGRIRGYVETDLPAIVDLINLCDRADGLEGGANLDELGQHFAMPGLAPERQVIVAEADGALVGFGRAFPGGGSSDERVYGLMIRVHPEARKHGLTETIAGRLVEIVRSEEAGYGEGSARKVRLRSYLFRQHESVRRVMEGMGLRVVREGWTMARSLEGGVEEPSPVGGTTIRGYRVPEDNRAALNALNTSFADYFDSSSVSEERWEHEMAAPYNRPDLSWLAVEGGEEGEVVGLSGVWVNDVSNKESGRLEGWIEGIGVVPQWRRRGVGRSLLLHSLRSLRGAGIETALADVDAGSEAAVGLFRSVGFEEREVLLQYECEVEEVRS